MLRDVFNRLAAGKTPDVAAQEKELEALRTAALAKQAQDRVAHNAVLKTIEAQVEKRLGWIAGNETKIRDKYMELVAGFEKGDREAANHLLFTLGDLQGAVLALPVLDANGTESTFHGWAYSAFAENAKGESIARTIEKALAPKELPPPAGPYPEKETEARREGEQKIAQRLQDIGGEMQIVTAILRLNAALEGPSAQVAAGLKSYLPFLATHYGEEKTAELLKGDALVNVMRAGISAFDTMMAAFPDNLSRSAFLLRLATGTEDRSLAKELKIRAAKMTGDYVRTGELSLFSAIHKGLEVPPDEKIHARLMPYLMVALPPPVAETPDLVTLGDDETLNPAKIALVYRDNETDKVFYVDSDGKQHETKTQLSEEEAVGIMNRLTRKGPFVAHQVQAIINPDVMGRIYYNEEEKKLYYTVGASDWQSGATRKDATRVLKNIAARPHFITAGQTLLNLRTIGMFQYNEAEEKLEYAVNSAATFGRKLDRDQAASVISQAEAYGRKQTLARIEKEYEGIPPYKPPAPVKEAAAPAAPAEPLAPPMSRSGGPGVFGAELTDIFAQKKATTCTADPAAEPAFRRGLAPVF